MGGRPEIGGLAATGKGIIRASIGEEEELSCYWSGQIPTEEDFPRGRVGDGIVKVSIKNEMETAVRNEAGLQQASRGRRSSGIPYLDRVTAFVPWLSKEGRREGTLCRCSLCRNDAIALALTILPPRYCRSLHYGLSLRGADRKTVEREVSRAVKRVALRPHHPYRSPVDLATGIRLIDFGILEGGRMIGPLLVKLKGACACETCREDTLAFGLNNCTPHYGVAVKGKMRMPPHQLDFLRHELLGVLSEAAKTIALKPRHGGRDRY